MTTPGLGLPDWAPEQETPWITANKIHRMIEAMAKRGAIEDRDLSAPPGSCVDGACYLVATGPTGAWAGQTGKLAIAVGANAASGWYFITVAVEGVELAVRDENIDIRHDGAAWVTVSTGGVPTLNLNDIADVDLVSLADGNVIFYDASNGVWYNGQLPGTTVPQECFIVAISDETTNVTVGSAKVTFRMPFAATLEDIRGSCASGAASGSPIVIDVNENGASILSTKLQIDTALRSSVGAGIQPVISDANLADDSEMTIDIDDAGDGAAGVKIAFYWRRIS